MARFLVPRRSIIVMRECSLEETLPPRHLARFIWSALECLDFRGVECGYKSVANRVGRPPYHPKVLAALWIYGMTQGAGTANEIAEACGIRDDFRWLAGGLSPCDQTLLNFLSLSKESLPSIWEQVLKAMQAAGCIDLSALAEDGTKLRANASPRSFRSADEIAAVVEKLKAELSQKLEEVVSPEASRKHMTQLQGLKDKLERAKQAAEELERRKENRSRRGKAQPSLDSEEAVPRAYASGTQEHGRTKFGRADFRLDPERDVIHCPAGQELRFVGVYPNDNGSGSYRLYKRLDCGDCPLKARCTDAKGRRLKIPVIVEASTESQLPTATDQDLATKASQPFGCEDQGEKPIEPRPHASLTDPEAVLMLATSVKRFEPSYNADITVTRHGVIVSEFLTKETVDFAHFPRALPNVLSVLGHPEKWAGDGHYATQANLVLADKEAVILYAPPQDREEKAKDCFTLKDFRHDDVRDVLVCPAGRDLEKVGTYGQAQERPYDLYARKDCAGCELKSQCTSARGRRVKKYHNHALVQALEARMEQEGEKMRKFRGSTVEPVNGQLKQHGLDRFHVRGLARCNTVLTLACIGHNLMKWKAMEESGVIEAAS